MRSICVPSFILIRESMFELHIKFSDGVPGGAVEPLCHAWVPALSGVLNAAGSNVCAHFQEFFDHVKPPQKCPDSQKKTKKSPKENNRIADFLLGGAHDMRLAKVVRLDEIYMCTEFHMNTCKYV